MPLTRDTDWQFKLRCFIEVMRETTYEWGTADCCSNACEWIRLCTGVDVFADFRGKYNDEKSAYSTIKKVSKTGATIADAANYVTSEFSMQEITPSFAQRGDVVLHESPSGQMLGIVSLHPARSLFLTSRGFLALPTRQCKTAWRV